MSLSGIFSSLPGLYATQAFVHSLVTAAIVEIAIKSWNVRSPFVRQRLLLIAIVFPVFSYPLYQSANPARGSVYFRMEALFDSGRWLSVELPGGIPLGAILLLVFSLTALVFLTQELLPILRHTFAKRHADGAVEVRDGDDPAIREALDPLPGEKPDTCVLEDEDPLIFSSTGKKGAVFLSSGLLKKLDVEELQAALAHEIAHVVRSRRPFLLPVFFLRIAMFFNPIVLVEFRRSVQEDEKICDEMAVEMTGKPGALASTLRKLYLAPEDLMGGEAAEGGKVADRIETYSHRLNIEGRISRLEGAPSPESGGEWAVFLATLCMAVAVNYFVV